ncbi:uncharacterized protein LOC131222776 [Magnolia sinica]|uniref:uncharacterized protein LOC131222776 n=1 Tax=Magnolia sinica TaxID=86752 RepID=UPI00265AE874|nr:uncharacterized protein LOC131222776 [Magnolia sinica]
MPSSSTVFPVFMLSTSMSSYLGFAIYAPLWLYPLFGRWLFWVRGSEAKSNWKKTQTPHHRLLSVFPALVLSTSVSSCVFRPIGRTKDAEDGGNNSVSESFLLMSYF